MKKKPELRQLRQLRITEAIFLKKNLNYVNYVITPITQLQKRQNHPLVLPLVFKPLEPRRFQLILPNALFLQRAGKYQDARKGLVPFKRQIGYF